MGSRLAVIAVSIICLISSAYFGIEAWLIDSGKPENIRRATRWMPRSAEAWRLMPQVDPDHATRYWRRVLQLAPRDIEARLALATDAELAQKPNEAEVLLLEAAGLDKGYLPAWSLANFYLRQARDVQFWHWARRAATFEVDLTGLFDLCLRVHPDPAALMAELSIRRPAALSQLLVAAANQDLLEPALAVADRVAQVHTPGIGEQLLWDADHLLKNGQGAAALAYWNLAAREHLLPYPPVNPPTLFNADFTHTSIERGFDWRAASAEVPVTTGHGLHVGLYGKQEDTATLVVQSTVLTVGHVYELRYRYRTNLPDGASPIRWQVGQAASKPFESGEWREESWHFQAGAEANGIQELKLVTQREPGTHRAAGEVEVAWVRLSQTD